MNRIQGYLNALADRIAAESELAGSTSSHKPDIGSNRERIVQLLLSKHLPNRVTSSLGGQVIGVSGAESNQIDVLVSNDIAVRFEENERIFVIAEGVVAAITIKSYLDKSAIEDCLANLASIPQLDRSVIDFKLLRGDSFGSFVERHPTLYVFAYDGLTLDTCVGHIEAFYASHPEIPVNRYAFYVVVNGQYVIQYCRTDVTTNTGYVAKAGTFLPMQLDNDKREYLGYPFIGMLHQISSYTDWLPFIHIHIDRYFSAGCGLPIGPMRLP
jgi:hypothetical protein